MLVLWDEFPERVHVLVIPETLSIINNLPGKLCIIPEKSSIVYNFPEMQVIRWSCLGELIALIFHLYHLRVNQ